MQRSKKALFPALAALTASVFLAACGGSYSGSGSEASGSKTTQSTTPAQKVSTTKTETTPNPGGYNRYP